jgi:hypothetical protein
MNWRLWKRGDFAAVLFAAAILLGMLVFGARLHNANWRSNSGFGPDWDCTNPGEGDAVCIKARPAKTEN